MCGCVLAEPFSCTYFSVTVTNHTAIRTYIARTTVCVSFHTTHTYVSTYNILSMLTFSHIRTYKHTFMHTDLCMHTTYVCTYIPTYTYLHTYVRTYLHIRTYLHTYVRTLVTCIHHICTYVLFPSAIPVHPFLSLFP